MCSRQYNMENNGIIIRKYKDVDTDKEYDLLIYLCSVNGINRDFVVGSIAENIENIEEVKKYISDIISFRFNNMSNCFISSKLKMADKNRVFDSINFSNDAYNLLINCGSYEYFKEKFIHQVKETTLDDATKRFSTIHNTKEPFNPISYYIELDEQKDNSEKILKMVI